MIRAVLDVNVLASGFVSRAGAPGHLLAQWTHGAFELVVSEYIITVLTGVLERPYFRRLAAQQRAANLALLRHEAILTTISAEVQGVAPDEEDDLVLATAVSGHAMYLVTGEAGLRHLGSYRGISVLSPRDFLSAARALRSKVTMSRGARGVGPRRRLRVAA